MRLYGGRRRLLWFAAWAGIAAIYFLYGRLGLRLAFVNPSATPIWAPSGIAVAALLLLGRNASPGIFAGAFIVNITTAGSLATCVGVATGNTLEAVTAAWLVNRFAGGRDAFNSPRGVFKFAVFAGRLSTMVSATIGVASLVATGYADQAALGPIWLTWWLGDAMGILLVAPLVILWAEDWKIRWNARQAVEIAGMFACLTVTSLIVFGGLVPSLRNDSPVEIVCVPMILWAAFRFGARQASAASVILSGIAIRGTLRGLGPFARGSANTSLLLLQVYVGVVAIMSIAVAASVWERKRIEARLRENERLLSQHAQDMEHFAYAANHDLQEPLRTVSLFAQLIEQRCAGQMGEEVDGFISRIIVGVSRMEDLMRGLFDYSRLANKESAPFEKVSMDELVRSVQKNLESLIQENHAQISCGELPAVEGNREQLMSLWQNLVANAIRYRGAEAPVVTIEAAQHERECVFSVRDNGEGIDPQHHEKIFGMFKRLHGSDVEGSGLGLAMARKIVEGHKGRIWVESEEGKGAVFFFAIPKGGHDGRAITSGRPLRKARTASR